MKLRDRTREEKTAWRNGFEVGRKTAREELSREIELSQAVQKVANNNNQ